MATTYVSLVSLFFLLSASLLEISRCSSAKEPEEYADPEESYDGYRSAGDATHEVKRKWGSDRMGLWGKRSRTEEEEEDFGDDDGSEAKSDGDPRPPKAEKKTWTSGKMGMWGKRRWDSKNMALWGRKRAPGPLRGGDYVDKNGAISLEKRRWSPGGMGVWGKRLDSAINQIRSQKSKWTSGSMGMWGK